MADRAGEQLGNYRLIRLLGQGGFAEVYLAEHIHLKTQAAVKVLHTRVADEDVESFRNEARILARLIHPNIVRVFDFGVDGSVPYLIMDYAPNGTLRKRHPRHSQLPLQTVVQYVKQVAAGLQYAHNERLIHRDIKPENLLVGRNNEILLSDFGIALVAQSSRLQSMQDVAGTAVYMAPEQFQGKPRTASDQYALAVVVYEWLKGATPFQGSFSEIASQHLFFPPPPLQGMVPLVNAELDHVIMTALAKDPKQRFGSVLAFANALEQASRSTLDISPTVRSDRDLPTEPASRPDIGKTPILKTPERIVPPSGNVSGASELSTPFQGSVQPPLSSVPPTIASQAPVRTEIGSQTPNYQQQTPRGVQPPPPPFSYAPSVPLPYPERRKGLSRAMTTIISALTLIVVLGGIFLFTPARSLFNTTANPGNNQLTQQGIVPGTRGGTWTDDVLFQPDSLIPNTGYQSSDEVLEQALYTPLFVASPNGTITPALATEIPTTTNGDVSTDLKTWTFKLKSGIEWSDGTPLNADDVDYTWKLWTNSQFQAFSTTGYNLITSTDVSSDKLSITFHLKQSYASFLSLWIDGAGAPLPQHHFASMTPDAISKSKDITSPTVVSGPFMISTTSNTQDTLVRNPHYYRAAEGLPYLDKVIFRFVNDTNSILNDLQTSNITSASSLDINNISSYKALSKYNIVTSPTTANFQLLNFDFKNPILGTDLDVRKAMAMAIDRQTLIKVARNGQAVSLCTDHGSAYNPGYQANAQCPNFDPTQAENLLTQDGWLPGTDGIRTKGAQRLQFQYGVPSGSTQSAKDAQLIQANLKVIGIGITIKTFDVTTFFEKPDHDNGNGLAEFELAPGYDAADNMLAACDQQTPNGENYGSYCNHTLDDLYAKEETTIDPAARQQIFNQVHNIYLTDFPFIVLYSPTDPTIATKRAHNYLPSSFPAAEAANIWEWWCDNGTC